MQQGQAGRAAQAFLRCGHHQAGLPRREITADAAEGGDRIHDEQRSVPGNHGRDRVEVVDRAAGRLAVHHADHGDVGPAAEDLGDARRRHGAVVGTSISASPLYGAVARKP